MARNFGGPEYTRAEPVTPSDSTVLDRTRALYVGGTGALTVTMANGAVRTLTAVPVGVIQLSVTKVMAATAATNIVALY